MEGRGLLSVELMHERVQVLDSADFLLKLVAAFKKENKEAFLFRAVDATGLHQLRSDRIASLVPPLTDVVCAGTIAKAYEQESALCRFLRALTQSQKCTFAFLRSAGLKSETEGFVVAC